MCFVVIVDLEQNKGQSPKYKWNKWCWVSL